MNVFSFAFVDPSMFSATMTLKYGKHFADNNRPLALSASPFQDCQHIVLRGPKGDTENWQGDVDHDDYPLLQNWPSARQLLDNIHEKITEHLGGQNITFGKAYIESLRPSGVIGWHVDDSPYGKQHVRFRLLASACAGGCWFSGGDSLPPGVGNLTYVNNQTMHSLINLGPVPQISVVVDARKPVLQ